MVGLSSKVVACLKKWLEVHKKVFSGKRLIRFGCPITALTGAMSDSQHSCSHKLKLIILNIKLLLLASFDEDPGPITARQLLESSAAPRIQVLNAPGLQFGRGSAKSIY